MTRLKQQTGRQWYAQAGVALAVFLISVSAACRASTPSSSPTPVTTLLPGVQGTLVYAKEAALWTFTPSTGVGRKLATMPLDFFYGTLAPSPDGTVMVYGLYVKGQRVTDPGGVDLYLSSWDGSNQRLLLTHEATGVIYTDPVWTADGRTLYFIRRGPDGRAIIERVNRDEPGNAIPLLDGTFVSVSSDGRRLTYLTNEGSSSGPAIWVADADGQNPRKVAGPPRFTALGASRFSPDGTRIVFAAILSEKSSSLPPPQSPWEALVRLLAPAPAQAHPVRIPFDLWLVNTDGSGLQLLTDLADETTIPAWSPDGKQVAFSGEQGIYVVDVVSNLVRVGAGGPGRAQLITPDFVESGLLWLKE